MRGRVLLFVAALGGVAALAQAPVTAASPPEPNWHAIVRFRDTAQTGAIAYLQCSRLWAGNYPDYYFNFITQDMWLTTAYNGSDWIEAGIYHGSFGGSYYGRVFFWGEMTLSGQFSKHKDVNIALYTNYIDKIMYLPGNQSWGIYRDGVNIGATAIAQHNGVANILDTGLESEDPYVPIASCTSTGLQKRATNNVSWSYDWPGYLSPLNDPPATGDWTSYASSMWTSIN
jgi:hypothetical protein